MEMLFSTTTGTITSDGDTRTHHEDYIPCKMEEVESEDGFQLRGVLWGAGDWSEVAIESETLKVEDYFEGKHFMKKV